MTELRILKWEGYPELSEWTHCYHKDPQNQEKKAGGSEELEDAKLLVRGHKPRNAGGLEKLEKARDQILP